MTREEEQGIIKRVLGGEHNAFEELMAANQDNVYNLALRMTGNEEDALDMSQEAFLRAYRNLENFRGESKFSVWLYRLTSNVCIDMLRKRNRTSAASLTYIGDDGETLDIEVPDLRWNPESETERIEINRAVSEGLSQLSPDYREILIMREINGLTYEEIGQALGLEAGTVKSRIFRARKRLCAILSESGNILGEMPSNGSKEM